jgi:hypothetical protein
MMSEPKFLNVYVVFARGDAATAFMASLYPESTALYSLFCFAMFRSIQSLTLSLWGLRHALLVSGLLSGYTLD